MKRLHAFLILIGCAASAASGCTAAPLAPAADTASVSADGGALPPDTVTRGPGPTIGGG